MPSLESRGDPIGRSVFIVTAPLLLAIVAFIHPTGMTLRSAVEHNVDLWLVVHLVQPVLFGMVALALTLRLRGLRGIAATLSRIGLAGFILFYTALDSVAGIAAGLLVRRARGLPDDEYERIVAQVDVFSVDFSNPTADGMPVMLVVTLISGLAWILAVVAAAFALRGAGAPLGACVLIGLSALYFAHDLPVAPVAMVSLTAGIAWIQFASTVKYNVDRLP